jgi:adenylosuccinate synthase
MEQTEQQYGVTIDKNAQFAKWEVLSEKLAPMIVDGVELVNSALEDGKRVIAEGANAALLDLDFGTYPYVTSSSTTAGGIATGLGISPRKIESVEELINTLPNLINLATSGRMGPVLLDIPMNIQKTEINYFQ